MRHIYIYISLLRHCQSCVCFSTNFRCCSAKRPVCIMSHYLIRSSITMIHSHIISNISSCICTYIYIYILRYLCICIRIYTYIQSCTYIYIYIYQGKDNGFYKACPRPTSACRLCPPPWGPQMATGSLSISSYWIRSACDRSPSSPHFFRPLESEVRIKYDICSERIQAAKNRASLVLDFGAVCVCWVSWLVLWVC